MKIFILFFVFSALSFSFPEKENYKGQVLMKNGEGKRKYLFYTVYTAALYLQSKEHDEEKVLNSSTVKKVIMNYNHDVKAKDMKKAWKKAINENCLKHCEVIKPQISNFIEKEIGIKKGDSIVSNVVSCIKLFNTFSDKLSTILKLL